MELAHKDILSEVQHFLQLFLPRIIELNKLLFDLRTYPVLDDEVSNVNQRRLLMLLIPKLLIELCQQEPNNRGYF